MKVRATQLGYYGKRRREGDVFEIGSEKELGSWMEPFEGEKPKRRSRKSETNPENEADLA